jgi:hypothetical protein
MNIGPVEDVPTFNNAFVLSAARDELIAGTRAIIGAWRGPGTLVVVTHGENILLMLGIRPREGGHCSGTGPDQRKKDAAYRLGRPERQNRFESWSLPARATTSTLCCEA